MGVSWLMDPPLRSLARELKQTAARERAVALSATEIELVERIRAKTVEHNGDNVERTRAYLDYFRQHTEIHWALLAHLVSRNAGWSMTDLRGELLTRLLSERVQEHYFHFLERANWLIFHDAYPQLLLYEESVKRQTNLFHLLPHFHVSVFMQAAWNRFWSEQDRELLAVCLIVNEQRHLEEQVMQDESYRKTVLDTLPFAMQELLSLNQILFPYRGDGRRLHLAGETVSHFASATERIALGKRLYALLFRDSKLLEEVLGWALKQPHTGSRKDFWPQIFHDIHEGVPGQPYRKKLAGCQLVPGGTRIFSPALSQAWKRVAQEPPAQLDWYRGLDVLPLLRIREQPASRDAQEAYCKTLDKIELAVIARGAIFGSRQS